MVSYEFYRVALGRCNAFIVTDQLAGYQLPVLMIG